MTLSVINKDIIYDVHEVHALKYADDSKIASFFEHYYKKLAKTIIYHSERTKHIIEQTSKGITLLFVPHFKYTFKKDVDMTKVSYDIRRVFIGKAKRFLFFGNLSYIKGIDIVIELFSELSEEEKMSIELVVAGKNVENIDFSSLKACSTSYHIFDKHINDDELVYLYKNTDYVLLPYRKSSQSGIFEMATYFKKPVLVSDIGYFKTMLEKYPSFGLYSDLQKYKNMLLGIIQNGDIKNYYSESECYKNEMNAEIQNFVFELKKMLKK